VLEIISIDVSQATYEKLTRLKEKLVLTDVVSCSSDNNKKEGELKARAFWNDDKLIDFMAEFVRYKIEELDTYNIKRRDELDEDQRESLR
jgi:predicted CopG family antitoxin